MKKIAIFGGSFDPVTNAHIEIARNIRDLLDCEVVFLPTKISRWKDVPTCKTHRVNMLKIALKDEERMSISTIECDSKSNKVSYTIDTILELLDIYKGYKLYYIIGSDQLENLHKWKNVEDLKNLVKFIVVEREGYPLNKENMKNYKVQDSHIKMKNISSTSIRSFNSIETKKEVLEYISDKSLYIKEDLKNRLNKDRYEHSVRVAQTARKLAKSNGFNPDIAYKAGLIHDCAKCIKKEKMIEMMLEYEPDHIGESHKVYHQYLAPVVAKDVYGVTDEDILHAIKYHTTADTKMNVLDKIIFCADKIEPGREYDTTFYTKKCLEDINIGFLYVYEDALKAVIKNNNSSSDVSKILIEQCKKELEDYELKTLVSLIDDKYGFDIKVYDVTSINPLTKYVINCSANNSRQANAIGETIVDCLFENRFDFHHKETGKDSNWTLIDANSFVVNIFNCLERESYGFEDIYKDLPQIDVSEYIKP